MQGRERKLPNKTAGSGDRRKVCENQREKLKARE